MAPYWLWRSVGGLLMVASHFVFAYNVWRMRPVGVPRDAAARVTAEVAA
jgi:cytochrome c oxidase cbb3-type subunit 1